MQLPWDEHFIEIVIPAWQAYLQAEKRLTEAVLSGDHVLIKKARYNALREGGAATFYVHHFAEVVLRAKPPWLPLEITSPTEVPKWLGGMCTMLRTDEPAADVLLLADVAEALKHCILTRRLSAREVSASEEVLVVGREYGQCRFGEGKYGGIDQVWVLAKSGGRVLSTILQNVIDAWRRAAGTELPPISSA